MAKKLKSKDLYVGQLIVRGEHPDPQVYTVTEIIGVNVWLLWWEGSHLCKQWTDYGDCYVPTIKQIEYSISENGRLGTKKDVEEANKMRSEEIKVLRGYS